MQWEKAHGTTLHVSIHPSTVVITRLKLDRGRTKILELRAKSCQVGKGKDRCKEETIEKMQKLSNLMYNFIKNCLNGGEGNTSTLACVSIPMFKCEVNKQGRGSRSWQLNGGKARVVNHPESGSGDYMWCPSEGSDLSLDRVIKKLLIQYVLNISIQQILVEC